MALTTIKFSPSQARKLQGFIELKYGQDAGALFEFTKSSLTADSNLVEMLRDEIVATPELRGSELHGIANKITIDMGTAEKQVAQTAARAAAKQASAEAVAQAAGVPLNSPGSFTLEPAAARELQALVELNPKTLGNVVIKHDIAGKASSVYVPAESVDALSTAYATEAQDILANPATKGARTQMELLNSAMGKFNKSTGADIPLQYHPDTIGKSVQAAARQDAAVNNITEMLGTNTKPGGQPPLTQAIGEIQGLQPTAAPATPTAPTPAAAPVAAEVPPAPTVPIGPVSPVPADGVGLPYTAKDAQAVIGDRVRITGYGGNVTRSHVGMEGEFVRINKAGNPVIRLDNGKEIVDQFGTGQVLDPEGKIAMKASAAPTTPTAPAAAPEIPAVAEQAAAPAAPTAPTPVAQQVAEQATTKPWNKMNAAERVAYQQRKAAQAAAENPLHPISGADATPAEIAAQAPPAAPTVAPPAAAAPTEQLSGMELDNFIAQQDRMRQAAQAAQSASSAPMGAPVQGTLDFGAEQAAAAATPSEAQATSVIQQALALPAGQQPLALPAGPNAIPMGPATPLAPPTGFDAPAGFRVPTVGTTAEPGLFAGPSGIPAPNAAGFVGPSGEAMSAADYAAQMARYPVNNGVGLPGYAPGPYAGFPGSTQPGTALELYRGGLANIPGTDLATLPGTDLATYGSRSLAQTPGTALELYRGGGAVDLFGGGSAVNPGMFGAPTGPAMPGPTGFPAPTGFAAPTGPAGIAPTGFGAPTGVAVPGMAPPITPITPTAITKELQAALDQAMGKGGKLTSRILSYQPQELLGYERTKTAAELAIREAIASGSTAEEAIAAGAEASGVGANLVKGSIGRAGLYGLAGEAGNYALKKILGGERDGSWDNAAGGAMRGAGWGAGVGSVVPVIGTALGAGVGALAGGAIGYFTGHDSAAKQTRDYWANQLDAQNMSGLAHSLSGLSPMTQSQVLSQIGMIQNTTKSPEEAKALVSQILLNLPAIAQQEDMYRANSAQQAANARYVRDTLMPKFTGYLDQSRQDAGNWALQQVAASQGMRNKNLGQIYAANASALPLAIDRQNASYMSQLAAIQQMQQPTPAFYPSILGGGSTVAPYTSPYGVPNTGILAGVNP